MKLRRISQKKNKRGVSPILGYVMLVALGIVMSGIAYTYLKTYVPQEEIKCPSSVSLFISGYQCQGNSLNITMKNNGKFDLSGYFIHASNDTNQKVATINLAQDFLNSSDKEARVLDKSYIVYSIGKDNLMTPKVTTEHYFNITTTNIKSIEITPIRYETIRGKKRFAVCSDSKIKQTITCSP